ncbi:MAG: Asp-tRNA(Asn)/Glu-tRNA(Gln) amidotransferase subunit GatA [Candidatus Lambdaproteobacteria bacterium]|nr:Asp-tRNA(Asn)/Glu-tRNA(Gln) amidotransferase subunit GatA [Candidatus Lambdaproteobacteria bacterium]
MTDLHELSIAEAAPLIEARRLSPVELTEALLRRIEALEGRLHCFITRTPELALERARVAEVEIARGGWRGPLHGIPIGLKDIYDTAGIRTTGHSRHAEHRIPKADAAVTDRLAKAGTVLLGKLATHEFATGGPSFDLPWPPARNPWDTERFTGGSSSGSGAGVAAGLFAGAMGSDTGGSIRLPAAYCGVAGIKPTFGRVSRRGVIPLAWSFDSCGPLARTVEDSAILLQAIAGHDPADPASADVAVPDFRAGLRGGVAGLRIGWVRHFYEQDRPARPEVIAAMEEAAGVLRGLGAHVEEVRLPNLKAFQACYRIIAMTESFAVHEPAMTRHPAEFGEVTRYRVLPGAVLSAADYVQAQRYQRQLLADVLEVLRDHDAFITATTPGPAPKIESMRPEANFADPPLTAPFNVANCPALSLCNGFAEGLPLAMQVAGRPFDEALVLRVAYAYEQATPWHTRRPGIDAGGADPP